MQYTHLPENLPAPVNDGAADHLLGLTLPALTLQSTDGGEVNLAGLHKRCVLYVYPMTGVPGTPLPDGWDQIPGARGCTPQSCAFKDHFQELQNLDTQVFGLSSQTTDYQREAKERLHLPFELLSDSCFSLKAGMRLPTFTLHGIERYKRITLIIENNRIIKVFYPVFPPDQNASQVLDWLTQNDSSL